MRYEVEGVGPEVAKEMTWLAWQACGGPVGMGFLQNRPDATKEDVWQAMIGATDYASNPLKLPKTGTVDADYVFGRMMKLWFKFDADSITFDDYYTPNAEYQMWCTRYPTCEELVIAALVNVDEKVPEARKE